MGNFLYARDKCCGTDVDYLLAYPTPKIVLLKDRLLGACNRIFCLAILVYVVLILIYLNQTYKEYLPPTGTVDVTIRHHGNFSDQGALTYCANDKLQPIHHARLPCSIVNETVVYSSSTNQFNVLTRLNRTWIEWTDYKKRVLSENFLESVFVQDIESYTLKIDHQWEVPQFKKDNDHDAEGTNYDMEGKLIDRDGNTLMDFGHGSDIFSIGVLLEAAGVGLDEKSLNKEAATTETHRYSGMTMVFEIQYIQDRSGKVRYEYHASQIKGAEHKTERLVPWNETHEIHENRHSISITFIPTGQIGRFNFYNLMLVIVSSYSLLLVSNTITETLMLYILPLSDRYYKLKYDESVDFSSYRAEHDLDCFGVKNNKSCCNRFFAACAGHPTKRDTLIDGSINDLRSE